MSAEDMRTEVCEVFAVPMGLCEDDTKNKRLFKFRLLAEGRKWLEKFVCSNN